MSAVPSSTALLDVDDLSVRFKTPEGEITAVNGLSFALERGQTFGIVGESGSGKSQSMLALMGLLAGNGRAAGRARFNGEDLLAMPAPRLNKIRGNRIAMIFQDPMTSLNPYLTVERQMTEVLELHKGLTRRSALQLAIGTLEAVRIPDAARRIRMYPHEFSGGMRQRIMIAMALLCQPDLLIADEPTTALDVTVQAQILDLIADLQRDFGSAVVFITHDLGVVAEIADDILVMYAGAAVEHGAVDKILGTPLHPYTWGLLESIPALTGDPQPLHPIPGMPPSLLAVPSGCAFHPRCEFRDRVPDDLCRTLHPELLPRTADPSRASRCHLRDPNRIFETDVLPRLP
jgi:peptide/nickel transport system ATP-binding protein